MENLTETEEEKYVALEGKSKEEILADAELTRLYIEFLEEEVDNLNQIAELSKQIAAQKDSINELQAESITQKETIISLLQSENKQLRTLLRKNGIPVPFN